MLPELGNISLILALALALLLAMLPFAHIIKNQMVLAQLTRRYTIILFVLVALAFLILSYCFVSNDFSVAYVAQNSSLRLPLWYKICAVWGAHEGSMLLWICILCGWMVAVTLFSANLPDDIIAKVLAILAWIAVGFLSFLLFTSNPFLRILPNIPVNGQDLNPLLQDIGFLFHPPMLYMGYVGFAIPFAFAIASLISGRLDAKWAAWSRPWTLAAWCFLSCGITLGSWWAYRELGWGGWWFWDPVENASFMPWLLGTALIHSLAVTHKRNTFKAWTVLLAIASFCLSLLGTFLVRSGILTSVHAFAVDPTRGLFMLIFLLIVIGASLLIYAWRANMIRSGDSFELLSRETFLMLNNVMLLVIMLTVLLGTLYPLLIDALGLGKLSVGTPYFNLVFVPLMIPVLFAMGIGPQCQWQHMLPKLLLQKIRLILPVSLVLGIFLPLIIYGSVSWRVAVGIVLALWIIILTIIEMLRGRGNKLGLWGMSFAHLGVAACVIGITLSSAYSIERDVLVKVGQVISIAGYKLEFVNVKSLNGPNYHGVDGEFNLSYDKHNLGWLHPQKRIYTGQQSAMTEAAINASIFRDIYLALGEPVSQDHWTVRVYYKPFIRWIWGGGLLILIGGILAGIAKISYLKRKPIEDV